jgi:hypothetical protein
MLHVHHKWAYKKTEEPCIPGFFFLHEVLQDLSHYFFLGVECFCNSTRMYAYMYVYGSVSNHLFPAHNCILI